MKSDTVKDQKPIAKDHPFQVILGLILMLASGSGTSKTVSGQWSVVGGIGPMSRIGPIAHPDY